jgi:hypothetical protein
VGTERHTLRRANGVVLTKLELVNGGIVVETAYLLETPRTPEKRNFTSLAEADAAYLEEVAMSEQSDLVARRLSREGG